MKFQRQLAVRREWSSGYSAPSTAFCVNDHGAWQVGRGGDDTIEDADQAPATLTIQAEIVPKFYVPEQQTLAAYKTPDYSFQPCDLYSDLYKESDNPLAKYGRLKSISLKFKNFVSHGREELNSAATTLVGPEDLVLYTKEFITQSGGVITVFEDFVDGKVVFNSDCSGRQPLWGFGGYYKPGCSLAEVQQVLVAPTRRYVSELDDNDVSTEKYRSGIVLSKMQFWQQHLNEALFMDDFTTAQQHSLAFDIENGLVRLCFLRGIDEQGKKVFYTYQAFSFRRNDELNNLIEIDFKL